MKKVNSSKKSKAKSKTPSQKASKPSESPPKPRFTSTGDIRNDLSSALSGDFERAGQFYYSLERDDFAPDPSLSVEGVGPVGRPLSEQGAKALISKAFMSSQNIWEVEPAKVSFKNPQWLEYVQEVASGILWRELGLEPWSCKPQCALKKLFIYGKGAHLPPHVRQDIPNESGVFATVMFILPSAFTGGEIHLSYGGHTAMLDLKLSKGSTSFVAWYADVVCAVKPITSGCRLALSYDLIHTSNRTPRPSLPDTQAALIPLRNVLSRWKAGQYKVNQSLPLFGYFLRHTCDTFLYQCEEMASFINSDGHKTIHLFSIAQELGFSLWLADMKLKEKELGCLLPLDHFEQGDGDEAASERFLDYMDDLMQGVPTITGCIPITPGRKPNLGYLDFKIPEEVLVPVGTLEQRRGSASDDYVRESGSLLLLFCNEDEAAVLLHIMGGAWTLQNLDLVAKPPTDNAKAVVSATLQELKSGQLPNIHGEEKKAAVVITLLDCAISWSDLGLWKNSLTYCDASQLGEAVAKGVEAFGLVAVQSAIQELVKGTLGLREQVQIINDLSSHLCDPSNPGWATGLMRDVVLSHKPGPIKDVPTLVSVAQALGLDVISNVILPNVPSQYQSSPFLSALAKELHKHRGSFPAISVIQTASGPTTVPSVSLVIRQILIVAAQQWGKVVPKGSLISKAGWVVEMVDLCLVVGHPDACSNFLGHVFHVRGNLNTAEIFKEVYIPLMPLLKKTAEKHGLRLSSALFKPFTFHIVSWYFAEILGSKDVVKEGTTWTGRRDAALVFLKSVGDEKEISEIMGQSTATTAPATSSAAGVKRKHEGE
ncbi:hypothetical protein H1R20_g2717, partial [Candolleomyces eurysporus]